MIGTKVSLRARMGPSDARSSGELVDAARLLALFGDLTSELLIRLDGDEGIHSGYESVEFLGPIFVGDYVEATAELLSVGETNRQLRFEAHKVIANLRRPDLPPSAAEVLREPILVCRAIGTAVTPKEMQRKPRELYVPQLPAGEPPKPDAVVTPPAESAGPRTLGSTETHLTEVILIATVPAGLPGLSTPQEVADEAARCAEAGASVLHLSTHRLDGTPNPRLGETLAQIRAKTDALIRLSTGALLGAAGVRGSPPATDDDAARALEWRPNLLTVPCGSFNAGDRVVTNARPRIRELATRARAASILPSLECAEVGHVEEGLELAERGIIGRPLVFELLLGIPGALAASEANLRWLVSLLPNDASWSVAAFASSGRQEAALVELALRLGGNVRIGDHDDDDRARSWRGQEAGAAPLVARAAAYARSIGRLPVSPTRAQALLQGAVPSRTDARAGDPPIPTTMRGSA